MQVLRTPDASFGALTAYPFAPHYCPVAIDGCPELRLHYVDEGPREAAPILLLHGEPSWSYLYRDFVPPLVAAGHRVVAPDLIGFGKSDKPAERGDYTYERHVAWMRTWLEALDLRDITLFCQDWGGLIGLRLVAAFPDRFSRLVIANTGLPTGAPAGEGFKAWLNFSQSSAVFPIGHIVSGGTVRGLTPAEIAAYDAPFPDDSFKAGARQFPALVPITPDHASVAENKAAWTVLEGFARPVLTCFSDRDPVTAGGDLVMQARIAGAAGQPHVTIAEAGHFLQEDKPDEIVRTILSFIAATGATP
ncbi:haloalkane dehalogenase [Sphingomonas sp. 37zxx]|uniref:haloalkane dehalogenase n=1 Tax=Sphingomonas sp. 37zxx TaxID=1550073 RepID=UPI00053BFE08|nr:haloalkane dehalogenase [Sphingomonas sp. 37zxx]